MRTFVTFFSLLCLPLALAGATKKTAQPQPPTLREQMLGHVERVVIVDSIAVDKDGFLSAYRLMPSAGKILSGKEVSSRLRGVALPDIFVGDPSTGFSNEFDDYLVWAQRDTTGHYRLAEAVRLFDGSWSQPVFTPHVLNEGRDVDEEDEDFILSANALFPFMDDDGQSLYFASDNGQSLGGLDIFVATKDPSDGEFLIPRNLGMPFNSEYDDYMMALDRQTGVGWWATDRNQLEDMVTVYIFALTDTRENIDPDDEQLETYATLSDWRSLLEDDDLPVVNALSAAVAAIRTPESRKSDFFLPMPGGKAYFTFSDFKNSQAANMMMLYLEQKNSLDKKQERLEAMRRQYHDGNRKLADSIGSLEQEVREDQSNLRILRSEIYRLELPR